MAKKTEVYSIRIDENIVEDYKKAIEELPILFKSSQLIEEYMKSIIIANKIYKKSGVLELSLRIDNKDYIVLKQTGTQKGFDI